MLSKELSMLPGNDQIGAILDLNWGSEVNDIMDSFLLSPLREFLERPSKKIRGRMVEIGFCLASGKSLSNLNPEERECIKKASDLLEALHSASLILDDIQDNSQVRRGEPTVHRKHGMPLALNAGNWLYFWPLQNVEEWKTSNEIKLSVYRVCHRGLLRAHFGQALDVGLNIFEVPKEKIKATCLASLELKSGALMAMGLSLGAVLGGATPEMEAHCGLFGHAFGIALQMFDDAGNATIEGPKQFEDLLLKRPSWLVAVASEKLTDVQYSKFKNAAGLLPDSKVMKELLSQTGLVAEARSKAKQYLEDSLKILDNDLFKDRLIEKQQICELADLLVRAYV